MSEKCEHKRIQGKLICLDCRKVFIELEAFQAGEKKHEHDTSKCDLCNNIVEFSRFSERDSLLEKRDFEVKKAFQAGEKKGRELERIDIFKEHPFKNTSDLRSEMIYKEAFDECIEILE